MADTLRIHFAAWEDYREFVQVIGRPGPDVHVQVVSRTGPTSEPLFGDLEESWRAAWVGMPAFDQGDQSPAVTVELTFDTEAARQSLVTWAGLTLRDPRYTWYPDDETDWRRDRHHDCYIAVPALAPRYPVYVISKGRADSRITMRYLDSMGVDYRAVVEPQERDLYAQHLRPERLLVLPFSNLGQGSIPARNWVWDHAQASGAARHWILDDNIQGFYRLHRNRKTLALTGAMFRAAEDFTDRYENVALAGMQYESFAARRERHPAFALNTRIYSCILIRNDLPFRWRGRYNEDTDLSLRILKAGWATVLFYAFLAKKVQTMTMTGGNTDELYAGNGRRLMAESLVAQHPDVVTITQKWNRWQHQVNYRPFRNNTLKLRPGVVLPAGVDEYGMRYVK